MQPDPSDPRHAPDAAEQGEGPRPVMPHVTGRAMRAAGTLSERLGLGTEITAAPQPDDVAAIRAGQPLEAQAEASESYLAACRREAAHLDALEDLEAYDAQHHPLELVRRRLLAHLVRLTADLDAEHEVDPDVVTIAAALGNLPHELVDGPALEPADAGPREHPLSDDQVGKLNVAVWQAAANCAGGTTTAGDEAAQALQRTLAELELIDR